MKKWKSILSAVLTLAMVLSVFAGISVPAAAETQGVLTYEINDGEASITECNPDASGDLVIPDTLGGCPVTSIGSWVFCDCNELTSVTIPASVESIGIYGPLFSNCNRLTGIYIASDNQYYTSDSYGVLFNKAKTELVAYPAGNSKTDYEIPNGVTSIGSSAFSGCRNLKNIILPEGLTIIGESAFQNCTALTAICIPASVTLIAGAAFSGCTSIKSFYVDPANQAYTSDSYGTLLEKDMSRLLYYPAGSDSTSYDIPDGITAIWKNIFFGCGNLKSITIPGSVTWIDSQAIGYEVDTSTFEYTLIDGFVIYGTPGTAAETYANENGITFVDVKEKPTTAEPTTVAPTTAAPTTAAPTTAAQGTTAPVTSASDGTTKPVASPEGELVVKDTDSGIAVFADEQIVSIDAVGNQGLTVEAIKAKLGNEGISIVSKDGEALTDDALVGTGCIVRVLDQDGKVLSEYAVLVPMDVDGDALITAQDARAALRAAAQLEALEGIYQSAADADADKDLTASDARSILRKAANLE